MTDAELATHVGQRSDDRTIGQIGRSDEAHRTHGQSRLDVANGIQPTRPIRPIWPIPAVFPCRGTVRPRAGDGHFKKKYKAKT